MSYNRFQYWVKGPRHKKLTAKYSIEARINNGDFEYPNDVKNDLEKQKKDLEKRTKQYWIDSKKRGVSDESIRDGVHQFFKKTRISIRKVEEELQEEELLRLNEFKQAAFASNYPFLNLDVKQMVWETLIENCLENRSEDNRINNTSDFYKEYNRRIERYGQEDNLKRIEKVLGVSF